MLIPTTEPFFFPGNQTGCLLIHGFTGAPTEMLPLGEHLSAQGFSVLGVRLFGHGTQIQDLNRARWQDWANSVIDGWNILKGSVEQIHLIGLSMGGALALYQAAALPIQTVISLSAPIQIGPDPRLPFLPILSKIMPYVSKGKDDWQDPSADQIHFSYDKYPTRAIRELDQLLQETRRRLPEIEAPALLMHSRDDLSVPHQSMETIFQELGTPTADKEKILLEKSGHVLTRDAQKEQVFQTVARFITDHQS